LEVQQGKRHEHGQRDHLLQDLELCHGHDGIADPVARYLQHVLEQRDSPAHQRRHDPWAVTQFLEVRIPRKGHEYVAECQQENRCKDWPHDPVPCRWTEGGRQFTASVRAWLRPLPRVQKARKVNNIQSIATAYFTASTAVGRTPRRMRSKIAAMQDASREWPGS